MLASGFLSRVVTVTEWDDHQENGTHGFLSALLPGSTSRNHSMRASGRSAVADPRGCVTCTQTFDRGTQAFGKSARSLFEWQCR